MLISLIKMSDRHRQDMGNIKELAESIADVGLLQPIVVQPDNRLVAGARRIAAFLELGRAEIPAIVVANLEEATRLLRAERDENTCRKDFLPSEAVRLGESLEEFERRAAKERQTRKPACSGKLPEQNTSQTRDAVGSAVGMSGKTYEKAKEIVHAAAAEPEKYGKFAEAMDRTGKVNGAHKLLKTAQAAESIRGEPPALPKGPFRVIVCDPPWTYENRAEDETHRASNPYPSMSIEEIKDLDVESRAHENCVLWLWTTNAHIHDAFDIVDTWGFTFKTILTWVKDRMGTGDWLRGQTEHCLMAIRGKPVIQLTNQTTALHGALRKHSQKPEEFYQLVESLCPGSKLEMFSRQTREGWIGHGNESK